MSKEKTNCDDKVRMTSFSQQTCPVMDSVFNNYVLLNLGKFSLTIYIVGHKYLNAD